MRPGFLLSYEALVMQTPCSGDCKRQFTVKAGTVFEDARLPLHKALHAVYLMTCSKKGGSAHQLHRV